jgi:hypothetical protein
MKPKALLIPCLLLSAFSMSLFAQPPGYPAPERGYGYPAGPSAFSLQKGLRFERGRDQNGYILRIIVNGIDPEAIQVSVRGRSLVVENQESHQVEQRSDRGSYQFSSSSSSMRRRFPLPPNADAAAMERREQDGVIVVTLPYATAPGH